MSGFKSLAQTRRRQEGEAREDVGEVAPTSFK